MSTTDSGDGVHVYTGIWINWAHGRIRGTTLTLTLQHGSFLAAFLALFVSFAGGMFWRLLCFILHQLNTTQPGHKRDLIHYQRQVILRNNGGPGAALLEFATLPIAWHGKARKPVLRVAALASVALLNISLFGAASILTAEVTRAVGNSTIIIGPACGGWTIKSGSDSVVDFESKVLADTYESAVYVRQCYGDNPTNLACGLLPRRRLGFSVDANATCPFAAGVCDYNDHSAFSMDTGMIDSYWDLGVNTPPSDRIKFRRVTTCAPLHGKRFPRQTVNETLYLFAGPQKQFNYTFAVSLHVGDAGYVLSAVTSQPDALAAGRDWTPDPLLNRTDADVTLMMLNQNAIIYTAPCDDPWMPAHISGVINTTNLNVFGVSQPGGIDTGGYQTYVSDFFGNILGCTDQYQVCNPNLARAGSDSSTSSTCTTLAGGLTTLTQTIVGNKLKLTPKQAWTANTIFGKITYMDMFYMVSGRGAAALNAQEQTFGGVSAPLPSTQWQTEVRIWFMTGLARLQSYMVEWATAPTNLDLTRDSQHSLVREVPKDPALVDLCSRQLVHDTGSHMSFSVLGLAIILALGGTLILAGMSADTLVGWLQTGTDGEYRRNQWLLEEKLQLQKAAYEGVDNIGDHQFNSGFGTVPTLHDGSIVLPPSSEVFLPRVPEKGGGAGNGDEGGALGKPEFQVAQPELKL